MRTFPRLLRDSVFVCAALALLPACESSGGGSADVVVDTGPSLCRSGTAQLHHEEGLVLGTCTVLPVGEAHDQKCDLMAYRHGDGLDLKSGVIPRTTERRRMHVFKSGGRPDNFQGLDAVPDVAPSAADAQEQAVNIVAQMAFTVEHNVTPTGYARVWVESVTTGLEPMATVHYEIVEP